MTRKIKFNSIIMVEKKDYWKLLRQLF